MNPQPAKAYSLIRLHKDGHPVRLVVSYTNALSTKLSKKLIPIVKTLSNFQPVHSTKNTLQFVNNIKDMDIQDRAMVVSIGVKNLFPSVPVKEVVEITNNLLTQNNCNNLIKNDVLNLLSTCLTKNYFEFNNKIYDGGDSLAMGKPLSPSAAEIFMDNLESKIRQHPFFQTI